MPSIQILLATYNGERFLQEQLDSLFVQTRQDLEILAADDGSDDGTLSLLEAAAAHHPGRVRILFRDRVGGVARNFMRLIDAADADYVLCCDQDDVWMPDKVERMVERCAAAESTALGLPVLVHSDLVVVDERLRSIAPSMFRYQKMRPVDATLRRLLLQSNVTGCAMLMNRALLRLIQGSGSDAMLMHDWWVSLAAAAFGRIEFLPTPTLQYRQHSQNTQGVGGWGWRHAMSRAIRILRGHSADRRLAPCAAQARAFLARFGPQLSTAQLTWVEAASRLDRQSRPRRAYALLRHGLLCGGFARSIARLLLA